MAWPDAPSVAASPGGAAVASPHALSVTSPDAGASVWLTCGDGSSPVGAGFPSSISVEGGASTWVSRSGVPSGSVVLSGAGRGSGFMLSDSGASASVARPGSGVLAALRSNPSITSEAGASAWLTGPSPRPGCGLRRPAILRVPVRGSERSAARERAAIVARVAGSRFGAGVFAGRAASVALSPDGAGGASAVTFGVAAPDARSSPVEAAAPSLPRRPRPFGFAPCTAASGFGSFFGSPS